MPTASFETFFAGFERLLDAHDASRATDPRFDVLEVLRVRHDEVLNCRFLAWLLDPRGSHGLGAALLQRVTAKLALRIPDEAWQEPIVVGTESSTQDGRIDIEVSSARFLLAIEAKVVSKHHTDQDVRYNAWLDACGVTRGVPLDQRHLVWLSRESARDRTTVRGVRRLTWQNRRFFVLEHAALAHRVYETIAELESNLLPALEGALKRELPNVIGADWSEHPDSDLDGDWWWGDLDPARYRDCAPRPGLRRGELRRAVRALEADGPKAALQGAPDAPHQRWLQTPWGRE
ncbi:MAG: PD-(D/E)XK nuclease family protein [Deltaproteobacteria bacterium]